MQDYIVYTPSKQALEDVLTQATVNAPGGVPGPPDNPGPPGGIPPGLVGKEENGNPFLSVTQTPNKDNGDQSIMITRGEKREDLEVLGLQILGEVINNEYVFEEGGQAIYEDVWKPFEELSYTDEDGETVTYTKPYKIGVFA